MNYRTQFARIYPMSEEFEPKIHQSESNFGRELIDKAERFFQKDGKDGFAEYKFKNRDWELLTKDLQQFGFRRFIDDTIGEAIFSITPQKLKMVKIDGYGLFLVPPNLILANKKIIINEKGENISLSIKESGEINGFKLSLNTETIPTKENVLCQYQQLALIIDSSRNYFFLKENFLIKKTHQGKEEAINVVEVETKRADDKEIRLFQKILAKDLQKIENDDISLRHWRIF